MSASLTNSFGMLALVFWSMNIVVTRHIGEAHAYGMPALSFLSAGLLLVVFDLLRKKALPWKSDANPRFWIFGGGAFVIYVLLYVAGLSYSPSRTVALSLGLINYFWPSLILVLMPLFFPCSIRWGILASGVGLCVVGVALSLLWGMSPGEMAAVFKENWPAFLIMAGAAFLWAFYSNAARKWGGTANGVGWFMLAGGACFFVLWLASGEPLGFSRSMLAPFLVHAAIVNAAAYMLWDYGVRFGDIGLMGTLANFLPLGSVLFGAWYLGDATTPGLWLGGGLVTCGAVLCRKGVKA